jgi:putative ABC transport system substrate-binding protein
MKRRKFIALAGASITWPFAATAQQAGRTYRLGVLQPFPREFPIILHLFEELRERGLAIRAAQQAIKTIPILGITEDMIREGFVDSLGRPDGNTTGISILATELDGKRQEILIEAVPGLRRMAVLANANSTTDAKVQLLQDGPRSHNVELSIFRIAAGEEISAAIDAALAMRVTALNVLASPMLFTNRNLIMDRVAKLGWPAMYQWPEMAGRKAALPPTVQASSIL